MLAIFHGITPPPPFSDPLGFLWSQVLLEAGASPNHAGSGDRFANTTPLHESAKDGDLRGCKLLVRYGADWSAVDNGGLKPIDYAIAEGDDKGIFVFVLYLLKLCREDWGKAGERCLRYVACHSPAHVCYFIFRSVASRPLACLLRSCPVPVQAGRL